MSTSQAKKSERNYIRGFIVGTTIIVVILLLIIGYVLAQNRMSDIAIDETPSGDDPVQVEPTDRINMDNLRYVLGQGDITVVEYTDMECPFCKTYHPTIRGIAAEYEDRIQYVMKHFPLNVHSKALREAGAVECAGYQNAFYPYASAVFEVTPSNNGLEDSELFRIAEELELDMNQFTTCLETEAYKEDVSSDALEAMATGATGTPHTLIVDANGSILTTIQGSVTEQQLRETIDYYLEQ